jgi:hypothetical protein
MAEDTTKRMGNVIRIDEGEIRGHLTALFRCQATVFVVSTAEGLSTTKVTAIAPNA